MVRESKTDAGTRLIDLMPVLRDELTAYKAQAPDIAPDATSSSLARTGHPNDPGEHPQPRAP